MSSDCSVQARSFRCFTGGMSTDSTNCGAITRPARIMYPRHVANFDGQLLSFSFRKPKGDLLLFAIHTNIIARRRAATPIFVVSSRLGGDGVATTTTHFAPFQVASPS